MLTRRLLTNSHCWCRRIADNCTTALPSRILTLQNGPSLRLYSATAVRLIETSNLNGTEGDATSHESSTSTKEQNTPTSTDQPSSKKAGTKKRQKSKDEDPSLLLTDDTLTCAQHLDPKGTMLPQSCWIHIRGTLPICSLEEVVESMEELLQEEELKGIIDLDAEWNPVQDPQVPTLSLEDDLDPIEAAHVVISPFGRPNGWHLKLANRSLANAILSRAEENRLRVNWKAVQVREYQYSKERELQEDPAYENGNLVVDDSMVRLENCPNNLAVDNVRYLLSRFDLAPQGRTIIKWQGETNEGRTAPLMYVVRFATAAWARAAIRELQGTVINGKSIRLIAYPKQIRYKG